MDVPTNRGRVAIWIGGCLLAVLFSPILVILIAYGAPLVAAAAIASFVPPIVAVKIGRRAVLVGILTNVVMLVLTYIVAAVAASLIPRDYHPPQPAPWPVVLLSIGSGFLIVGAIGAAAAYPVGEFLKRRDWGYIPDDQIRQEQRNAVYRRGPLMGFAVFLVLLILLMAGVVVSEQMRVRSYRLP